MPPESRIRNVEALRNILRELGAVGYNERADTLEIVKSIIQMKEENRDRAIDILAAAMNKG